MTENSEPAKALKSPELVFGLIGAVGIDTEKIVDLLTTNLIQVGYKMKSIHLIDGVRQLERWSKITTEPLDARYTSHMDAGNGCRQILQERERTKPLAT